LGIAERPLALDELAAADAVLTSGALRGLEAVTHLSGQALPTITDRARTLLERFPPLR
jgi:branched-subunit amino acid aminotransferase/4-amino-4-deoxychorismate lyase